METERERYGKLLKEIFDKEPKFHSWGAGLRSSIRNPSFTAGELGYITKSLT
jgi:hypothetical protein